MTNYYPVYEKELLNRYLEAKGNIRVFVRVRPILKNDFKAYEGNKASFSQFEEQLRMPNSN